MLRMRLLLMIHRNIIILVKLNICQCQRAVRSDIYNGCLNICTEIRWLHDNFFFILMTFSTQKRYKLYEFVIICIYFVIKIFQKENLFSFAFESQH